MGAGCMSISANYGPPAPFDQATPAPCRSCSPDRGRGGRGHVAVGRSAAVGGDEITVARCLDAIFGDAPLFRRERPVRFASRQASPLAFRPICAAEALRGTRALAVRGSCVLPRYLSGSSANLCPASDRQGVRIPSLFTELTACERRRRCFPPCRLLAAVQPGTH